MIKVEGENGSYWVWPVEDLGPSFASSPQRYATAELPFNDTVEGDQWIISETFGYFPLNLDVLPTCYRAVWIFS